MPKYSVIVPVYNRPQEVRELLISLSNQKFVDFEVVIVEDGSTLKCDYLVSEFESKIDIRYFFKENSGPGDSRNFGMSEAKGDYFLFFDSDCVLPDNYFGELETALNARSLDAFGGPDNAHDSFTDTQKAINFAMTSFLTTGGVRGGKKQLDKFQPRSFNMGMSKEVFEKVGGFRDIHPGEDPDLSYRIMDEGFRVGLIKEAFVYHKRRVNFKQNLNQVYKFSVVRVILNKWHPQKINLVFFLPSLFTIGSAALLMGAIFLTPMTLTPLGIFTLLLLIDSLRKTYSLKISIKSILASFIQLYGYGYGFLLSFLKVSIFKLDERKSFSSFFFSKET